MLDLFWEPKVGELVRAKPSGKVGIRPFDDYPLLVKRINHIDGYTLYTCETTGPVETKINKHGHKISQHPCWQGSYFVEDLMPADEA